MSSGIKTLLYPTKDLAGSKKIFTALFGMDPQTDAPYYVGYDLGPVHIGLVPRGHDQGMTGPVPFFEVDDIEASTAALQAAGGKVKEAAHDVGGGRRVATILDSDGNPIGLLQDPR